MKKFLFALPVFALFLAVGCDDVTTDQKQSAQQERIMQESNKQVGMPNIKNFRERKLLKDILELRDQDGLVTYTYLYSEQTGKLKFFGESIGYGIPYATQYTNPQYKPNNWNQETPLPQADPNGLFSPISADGTWVLMKDPKTNKVLPIFIEPRCVVSPFKLPPSVAEY